MRSTLGRQNVHLGLTGKHVVDFLLMLTELFSLWVTAELLRAKRYRKSAISLQHGHFDPKFQVEWVAPHQSFLHGYLGQWMPYNSVADSFHTKKLCTRLSTSEVWFFLRKSAIVFLRPPLGYLRATYDDHLRFIGKRIVDCLLALIELFFARCYAWGATSDYRFKIGDFAPMGASWPEISGRRGCPSNHSSSQKTRLNYLSYGI